MSLGTGALKVGREPEHLRRSRKVSMATLRAGTTRAYIANWHCHTEGIQWKILTRPHTYQCKNPKREGRARSQNLQRFSLTPDPQRSAQNGSMKCISSHNLSKGPCGHPTDLVHLRGRKLTALACHLTLLKLHLATFKLIANRWAWELVP